MKSMKTGTLERFKERHVLCLTVNSLIELANEESL